MRIVAHEVTALADAVAAPRAEGGLGVRVTLVQTPDEPYADAAELCADIRQQATMKLRAASVGPPHPALSDGAFDQIRTVRWRGHRARARGGRAGPPSRPPTGWAADDRQRRTGYLRCRARRPCTTTGSSSSTCPRSSFEK
jgi:hypothetical protein